MKAGEKRATEKDNLGPLSQIDVFLDQMTARPGHSCGISTLIPKQFLGCYHDSNSNKQHNHSYLLSHVQDTRHSCPPTSNSIPRNFPIFSSYCHKNRTSGDTLSKSLTQKLVYCMYSKDATNHFKMVKAFHVRAASSDNI